MTNGWIDYCKAREQMWYPPEMNTDDNGYRIIVQHLGLPEYGLTYFDSKTKERKSYDLERKGEIKCRMHLRIW